MAVRETGNVTSKTHSAIAMTTQINSFEAYPSDENDKWRQRIHPMPCPPYHPQRFKESPCDAAAKFTIINFLG